jgi:adenosylcobinamide-phosphate synthase
LSDAIGVLIAFALDRGWGEPPPWMHPVVWMGRALSSVGAPWPTKSPRRAFMRGTAAWIAGSALTGGLGWLAVESIDAAIGFARGWLQPVGGAVLLTLLARALLIGVLLKPMFSWKMLRDEVLAVEQALELDLQAGRHRLQRIVSRDTSAFDAIVIRESALESLAENLNDSVIAPLFWFVVGGLPAAAIYRFANTADAMWGFRGRYEWAGKWSARADDVLSFLPARLSALLIACAAGRSTVGLAAVARQTPSPNGGWPMGMLALALNARLTKPGAYVLNAFGTPVTTQHIHEGLCCCERAVWLGVVISMASTIALSAGPRS